MAVYGIQVRKIDERLDTWNNTYHVLADSLGEAQSAADVLATAEASIHSTLVTITETHCWLVGATVPEFSNVARDYAGELSVVNALPPWFTAEVTLESEGSYPGYKRFRCRIDRGLYTGPNWHDDYLLALETFADVFTEVGFPLCTRSGVAFTGMAPVGLPAPLQLSKAWYNRTTP